MVSESQEIFLQRLEEFLQDEDKIVTSQWLSGELEIEVFQAKNVMLKYLQDLKQTNSYNLSAIYMLLGQLNDGGLGVTLAEETELQEKRKLYHKISSECVYSVQRKPQNVNLAVNALTLVEPLNIKNPQAKAVLGLIVGSNCTKRESKLKSTLPVKQENVKSTDAASKNGVKMGSIKKEVQKPVVQKKANTVKGLFANAPVKKEKPEQPAVVKQEVKIAEKENAKEVLEHKPVNKSGNKKRQRKDDTEQPIKRRKRIVEKNDSDSDDMFGDVEQFDDVIEKSDEEEQEPVYKPEIAPVPKNKKRKQVDKTYEEDGYILTKKEYVYESASEEEKELIIEKKEEKIEKKVVKPEKKADSSENDASPKKAPGKGKKGKKINTANQPTLMNFFKKK